MTLNWILSCQALVARISPAESWSEARRLLAQLLARANTDRQRRVLDAFLAPAGVNDDLLQRTALDGRLLIRSGDHRIRAGDARQQCGSKPQRAR